jgi:hypothetical protein
MEEEELKKLELKKLLLPGRGYQYETEKDEKMVELHFNDIKNSYLHLSTVNVLMGARKAFKCKWRRGH